MSLGPTGPRETWRVRKMTVNLSTGTGHFRVYRGPARGFQIDGTDTANFDVSETDYELKTGEFVTGQFTLASPGATGQFLLEGDQIFRGRIAY